MEKRNMMYIAISIICVIAIILGVYYQIFSKKVINENQLNTITNTIEEEVTADDPKDLLLEFNKLFTNNFDAQGYETDTITKIAGLEEKDVIYTIYDIKEEKSEQYQVDIKLPVFNISSDVATEFNNTTQTIFADKASNVLSGTNQYTIYNVEYTAYLNENILSLVIKSTLKEGNSAQRIIVQTYNYDIETGKRVTLNDILEINDIKENDVNKKIEKQVKEANKQAETISGAIGQTVYKRDLNNAMYLAENVSNFFVGKNGQIYIIYAYGNNNATSEIDIIKVAR